MPVLTKNGHVAGIVSEADVLRKEERDFGRLGTGLPHRTRRERAQADARTVTELMTKPVITIHPDAPVGAAARLMNGHRIRRCRCPLSGTDRHRPQGLLRVSSAWTRRSRPRCTACYRHPLRSRSPAVWSRHACWHPGPENHRAPTVPPVWLACPGLAHAERTAMAHRRRRLNSGHDALSRHSDARSTSCRSPGSGRSLRSARRGSREFGHSRRVPHCGLPVQGTFVRASFAAFPV